MPNFPFAYIEEQNKDTDIFQKKAIKYLEEELNNPAKMQNFLNASNLEKTESWYEAGEMLALFHRFADKYQNICPSFFSYNASFFINNISDFSALPNETYTILKKSIEKACDCVFGNGLTDQDFGIITGKICPLNHADDCKNSGIGYGCRAMDISALVHQSPTNLHTVKLFEGYTKHRSLQLSYIEILCFIFLVKYKSLLSCGQQIKDKKNLNAQINVFINHWCCPFLSDELFTKIYLGTSVLNKFNISAF